MYFVYILISIKTQKRYIGYTNDLRRRIEEHNRSRKGFDYRNKPFELMCYKVVSNRNEAIGLEKYLKSLKGGNQFKNIVKSWVHSSVGRAAPF